MNASIQPPTAGIARIAAGFPVPEVVVERTPARRTLQRWDRATANLRPSSLGARGSQGVGAPELPVLAALAVCGTVAVLLAFW